MERNVLLTIEYDGSGFSGWQKQPNARTVQGELESALEKVTGCQVQLNGASRTDAGVHALGQRASFRGDYGIPTDRIATAANNLLAGHTGGIGKIGRTGDVRILSAEEKPLDFNARFDACGKQYRYIIQNSSELDIFQRKYCYQIPVPLDLASMEEGADYMTGTHDFRCFQAAGGAERESTVRTIHGFNIFEQEGNVIIDVVGDGFLYNMVRIMVGTLVEIGLGKKSPWDVPSIIEGGDRQAAGHTAPPGGLYLVEVFYR